VHSNFFLKKSSKNKPPTNRCSGGTMPMSPLNLYLSIPQPDTYTTLDFLILVCYAVANQPSGGVVHNRNDFYRI
jgi:hypothetical protein